MILLSTFSSFPRSRVAVPAVLRRETIFAISGRALQRIAPPAVCIMAFTLIWTIAVMASGGQHVVSLARVATGYSLVLSTIGAGPLGAGGAEETVPCPCFPAASLELCPAPMRRRR